MLFGVCLSLATSAALAQDKATIEKLNSAGNTIAGTRRPWRSRPWNIIATLE